jgi:acetolactate synthase-1/2/3 large subunit
MYRELQEYLGPETIFVGDGESTQAVARTMHHAEKPARRLDAGPTGCMGVGLPYAIGAQIAAPGDRVVCAMGDYSFGWNGMEIETASRYNLPIMFVVANNGSVRQGGRVFDMRGFEAAEALRYDVMMEAFGGHGEMVRTIDELKPALERAAASGKPSLVNVAINPWVQRKSQPFSWLDRLGRMRYTAE